MSTTAKAPLPGFKGEYLWEFDWAAKQLFALAEAIPAERYGWRPAETARSVSEVLVHLAAGGRSLLVLLGLDEAPDLYGKLEGEGVPRMMAIFRKNQSLEKSITDKAAVIALLRRGLEGMRTAFAEASDGELERPEVFFGERSTVRRLYLRGLCHLHEHMGQLIAYTRAMGMLAPWHAETEALLKKLETGLLAHGKQG